MEKEEYRKHLEPQPNRRISADIVRSLGTHGISVRKSDYLFLLDRLPEGPLQVTMTLCPLYAPASLKESKLISEPATIEQSRVAEKWKVGIQIFEAIKEAGLKNGRNVVALLTLADLGVITGNALEEDSSILTYHETLYRVAAGRDLEERLGIPYCLERYSRIVSGFPRFISATGGQVVFNQKDRGISSRVLLRENPSFQSEIVAIIDRLIQERVIFDQSIYNPGTETVSAKTQEFIVSLMRQVGSSFNLIEGLMRQYGTFDARTTRRNALNIFIERQAAALLLQLTDLFPHRNSPRVDILC